MKRIVLICLAVACLSCAAPGGPPEGAAGADPARAVDQVEPFDLPAHISAEPEPASAQTAVPEPGVIALLLVGGGIVLLRRRR